LEKALKHKDLVKTREGYAPVYVVNDEKIDSMWRTFIPHNSFYELLEKFLDILEGRDPRTALWLQGAYGTGKSHACGVLKHLFSDPLEQIESYISGFSIPELKGRLKGLRQRKRYLTIALKGDEGLYRPGYLELVLREKIREEAKKRLGITIKEKTEIDAMVELLERFGEEWFKSKKELSGDFDSLEAFLEALKGQDETALERSFETLTKEGHYFMKGFKTWIESALETLKGRGIDGIIILWDEVTSLILDPDYASKLQNLAENKSLYFLIVTHRTYEQVKNKIDEETLKKIRDRFVFHRFEMEEVTTFHILSRVIEKKNHTLWKEVANRYWQTSELALLSSLISEEERGDGISKEKLRELYPFHPYTAFLITYTVNHFLSANRSIFDFLYSEREGAFQSFLEKEVEKEPFLTPDYLWNFFYSSTEKGIFKESIGGVRRAYNFYEEEVSKKGENYLRVFKTILIFNLLIREADTPRRLLKPTEENLRLAYTGTPLEGKISEILKWIDEEGIVRKDPEGNFRIEEFNLPPEEVKKEEKRLRSEFENTPQVIKNYSGTREKIEMRFSEGLLRETDLHIVTDKSRVRHFLEKDAYPYALKVVIGIPTFEKEISEFRTTFKKLSKEYPNAVFLTLDTDTEDFLQKFIHFRAREEVSKRFGQGDNTSYYHRQVETLLDNLVESLRRSYVYLTFKEKESKETASDALKSLAKASKEVFSFGAENLPKVNNENLWKSGATPAFLTKVLSAKNLRELERTLKNLDRFLLDALRDEGNNYVVNEDLKVKEGAPKEHPLVALKEKVGKLLEKKSFVRPEDFFELQRPPFGVYNVKLYGFLLAITFKNFEKDLYAVGRGRVGVVDLQSFILQVLKGEDKGDVALRLGSETDRRLLGLLKEVFHNYLSNFEEDDLAKLRWDIRKGINEKIGWPLWVVEYLEIDEGLKDAVRKVSEFLKSHEESFSSNERQREELVKVLEREKIDLRTLLSDPQNVLKGKERFLQLELSGRPIDKKVLEERIKRFFTNEPTFWDRGYVERKVKEIVEELLREKDELERVEKERGKNEEDLTMAVREPLIRKCETFQEGLFRKLEGLNREELLDLLKRLMENHPELLGEVRELLG